MSSERNWKASSKSRHLSGEMIVEESPVGSRKGEQMQPLLIDEGKKLCESIPEV